MSALKHTPGPWVNDNGLVNGQESRTRYQPSVSIDIFDASEWPDELSDEAMANARLIAAAPEMLEILQTTAGNIRSLGPAGALASVYEPYKLWLSEIERIIAKAEGRS